ncbi:hypothetical protein DZF91_01220 [Actinomadura logoneensis]|uniref:Uncharacterized protein n=1 Tax=Actinomadura logoneensis TaxID=2293572 RepID=A0A372JTS8_9ACTN|nr:hypothetical protein [Actinomadura logoneensis]RFU43433.1 hypothetical protein DZF91_01220 [Actinomadura logoneensis]
MYDETQSPARDEILDVAREDRAVLYADSVVDAAAHALYDMEEVLFEHGIYDPYTRSAGSLPERILRACAERFVRECLYVDEDVEPVKLLDTVVWQASVHLDAEITPVEGPVMAVCRAEVGYVKLPREDAPPLLVTLGRPDESAARSIMSSAADGVLGPYRPGPWTWHLTTRTPGAYFVGDGTRIVAPAPSHETAAEVGALVARVLAGELAPPLALD